MDKYQEYQPINDLRRLLQLYINRVIFMKLAIFFYILCHNFMLFSELYGRRIRFLRKFWFTHIKKS